MSALVDCAIDAAGLGDVLAARRLGSLGPAQVASLRQADLLALGALADRVCLEEVGASVKIYTGERDDDDGFVLLPGPEGDLTGLDLLREVAIARISGPHAVRVRVDWVRTGLELAQIAIGFGASELVGQIASKRGLPLAEGELAGVGKKSRRELASVVKRKELAAYVRRAGREPVFIGKGGAPEGIDGAVLLQEAT